VKNVLFRQFFRYNKRRAGLFLALKKRTKTYIKQYMVRFKEMNWQRGAGGVVLGRKMYENTGTEELA